MINWFKEKLGKRRSYRVPAKPTFDDEWITIPFRFAEAARVSIHTIGTQQEIPVAVRLWIAQWLAAYNQQVVDYMRENYGPDIFPILDRITCEVMPDPVGYGVARSDSWEKWETEFREGS
jgi:hypothetical protein